jgi:rubrerythrin
VPVSQIWKDQPYQPADDDLPGDPVCLLRRVCQRCGSVADEDPPTACPTCHAAIPAD